MIKVERTEEEVVVTFTTPAALVLYGLLHRYEATSQLQVFDQAEQLILWRLFGSLKPTLLRSLQPNAQQSIKLACETVRCRS